MNIAVESLSADSLIAYQVNVVADWWTRPTAERIDLWSSAEYQASVMALWLQAATDAPAQMKSLFQAIRSEGASTIIEYERLFVGPVPPDCPPYETLWRLDRPQHEKGLLCGVSTDEMGRLYDRLGLEVARDHPELSDHIAIQLEGMAYALATQAAPEIAQMTAHLQAWLPQFCPAVEVCSQLDFYARLAGITLQLVARLPAC